MKKLIIFVCALALTFNAFATITGSAHDMKANGWALTEICAVCHTPHNAVATTDAPLWSHTSTVTVFTPYGSGYDMEAAVGQPTGISLMCLSCHDDTIALDAFVGAGAPASGTISVAYPATTAALGTDLRYTHPVSFNYAAHQATDGELFATNASITALLSSTGTVECSSCHDVHNTANIAPLQRMSNVNSALCLTCHDK